jgi:hypothetical protein
VLPRFLDVQQAIGFPEYFREAARYAISTPRTQGESPESAGASPVDSDAQPPASPPSGEAPCLQPEEGSSQPAGNGAQSMRWPPERFTIIPDPELVLEERADHEGNVSPGGVDGEGHWSGRSSQGPGGSESASNEGAGRPVASINADVVIPPSTQLATINTGVQHSRHAFCGHSGCHHRMFVM